MTDFMMMHRLGISTTAPQEGTCGRSALEGPKLSVGQLEPKEAPAHGSAPRWLQLTMSGPSV